MLRRRAITAGFASLGAGIGGCFGTGEEDSDEFESNGSRGGGGEPTPVDDEGYPVVADVDWGVERRRPTDPENFRFWLTMHRQPPGNGVRFNYADGWQPDHVGELFDFTDLAQQSVTGSLLHANAATYLGTFDVDELLQHVEAADEYERTGEYGGFHLVNDRIAIGPDAIVVSTFDVDYDVPIDRYNGKRKPLEAIDPGVTRLFEELPPGGSLEGEYVAPIRDALGVETGYLRGISSDTVESRECTWVYLFTDESHVTDTVLSKLESPLAHVRRTEIDGRVARLFGTV
ncbi:hypothetical protein [Halovivax limisalsi]|uniref:hypothetical protein n=1 Tax=Halovivax limisalsi TaxID=1453760 RepID=UPI001FFD5E17|nr:hypothetical protein [Halovivax limisalsi]